MKRYLIVMGALVCMAVAGYFWQSGGPLTRERADRLIEQAAIDAEHGLGNQAIATAEKVLAGFPDHHRALELVVRVRMLQHRRDDAAPAFEKLSDDYVVSRFDRFLELADRLSRSGRLYEAELLLKRLYRLRPEKAAIRQALIRSYRISGQNLEALPYLAESLRADQPVLGDLLMACGPHWHWPSNEEMRFMRVIGQRVDDPFCMLGYARHEIKAGNQQLALDMLEDIFRKHPTWQPANLWIAMACWQLGREDDWRKAMSEWDSATLDDADAWFLLGMWHQYQKDFRTSFRCLCEALRRDPKHLGACAQVIVVLKALRLDDKAVPFKVYLDQATQIEHHCIEFGRQPQDPVFVRQIAAECDSIGWDDEAGGWRKYAQSRWPTQDWTQPAEAGTGIAAAEHPSPDPPFAQLLAGLEPDKYPLPRRLEAASRMSQAANTPAEEAPGWRLDDESRALGIIFNFNNGLDPLRKRAYMFEYAGPGVGILDFDGDGWPDLHITQGAPWPLKEGDTSLRDELYRNQGDGTFVAVTASAGLGDPGYSQGPAVGDYDNDGFPDVYVCNIGANRCYHNNGDGTFSDVTQSSGTDDDLWSQCAAWADLNFDGLPDLFVVNYLAGNVFERACVSSTGQPVQCSPSFFPGSDDRLFVNRGDGSFEEISKSAGTDIPNGKGLGITVGRFDNTGRLSVYLANDLTPNFLFVPAATDSDGLRFDEIGAASGVAFGPDGTAQSSMGIATGDMNNDGRLDLYVTNFLGESSNLLLQRDAGQFEDVTSRSGITAGGFTTEGWGTQFLDIDCDGRLDLFVSNGHVAELDPAIDRMPAQVFRNLGNEKVALVSGPALGSYFEKNYLGRSVAVWDWNRDGLEDVVVTHVSDPVALLTNHTKNAGHRIGIRLVGVNAARDPVGTQVRVRTGKSELVRELVSGDGYAATNERRLTFGLGETTDDVELQVDWAGGESQQFGNLAVDGDYLLIQGRVEPVLLGRFADTQVTAAQ